MNCHAIIKYNIQSSLSLDRTQQLQISLKFKNYENTAFASRVIKAKGSTVSLLLYPYFICAFSLLQVIKAILRQLEELPSTQMIMTLANYE